VHCLVGWNISQDSVATHLRRGGIFINNFIANFHKYVREKIVKIGQYLAEMDKSIVSPFLTQGVYGLQI